MPLFMLFFITSFLGVFLVLVGLHIRKMMKLKDESSKEQNVASGAKSLTLLSDVFNNNKSIVIQPTEQAVNPAIIELVELGNGFGSTTISGKTREETKPT